jgi:ABC-2 type transport system permease protein
LIVTARLLHDRRRSALWWSLSFLGLVLFTMAFFPSIRGETSFEELAENIPEALRSLFGIDRGAPLTSAPGYLHARLFASLGPILVLVLGVGLGARVVAGDEEEGTLELLLGQPVTRRRVAIERLVAAVGVVTIVVTAFAASVLVSAPMVGALDGVDGLGLAGAFYGIWAFGVLHLSLAFAVGAATGRRSAAIAATTAVSAFGYLVEGVAAVVPAAEPLRFGSVWHWYLGRNMLADGPEPAIAIFLPLAAVAAAGGVALFARRDLR